MFRHVDLYQAWGQQQHNSTNTVCRAITRAASKKTLAHPGLLSREHVDIQLPASAATSSAKPAVAPG